MFKRSSFVLFSVLALAVSCSAWAQPFYHCENRSIVSPGGDPFLIRGMALSFLLNPEAYALHLGDVHWRHLNNPSSIRSRVREILGNDADAQAFWNAYEANLFSADDLAALAAEGFNTIRIPFNYRLISPEDSPGTLDPNGLQKLNQLVQLCKTNGLAVILDMHSCPGGQSHDGIADPEHRFWYWSDTAQNWLETGVACLWEFNQEYFNRTGRTPEFNKQRTADIWRAIAAFFANETAIIGYELVNEPCLPSAVPISDLRNLLIQITSAIREVDANHIVFVSGNDFASSVEGLVPAWDSNMAIGFHKYWCAAAPASISAFVQASTQYNIPLCLTETGENSNDWFFQMRQLLEASQIGWCWWAPKKVSSISAAFSAGITPDYQYVIDNFRDSPIDAVRARTGLMQMAAGLATAQCDFEPGYFASLLSSSFGTGAGEPFVSATAPGKLYCVNYNVGANGIAYADADSRNENGISSWNQGWTYRNDGVDITTTSDGCGYKVAWTANGESLKYAVNVQSTRKYKIILRTASPSNAGQFRLYRNGTAISSIVSVPSSGGWESWRNVTLNNISLPAGPQTIELRIVTGGFDLSSITFQ